MATFTKTKKAKRVKSITEHCEFSDIEYVVSNEKLSPAELKMFLMFFTAPKKGTTSKDWRLPNNLDLISIMEDREFYGNKIKRVKTTNYWKQAYLKCHNFDNYESYRVVLVRDL